jgi:hypothetical protein
MFQALSMTFLSTVSGFQAFSAFKSARAFSLDKPGFMLKIVTHSKASLP